MNIRVMNNAFKNSILKKIVLYGLIISALMVFAACSKQPVKSDKLTVAVTILPEETFVKAVGGDLVEVVTLVPPGASPENYQPAPKQMAGLSDASLYFTIGMASEKSTILPGAASLNNTLKVIDLAKFVDDVYPARYFDMSEDPDHTGRDPHMWMSPQRVIVMINVIKEELSTLDPQNASLYAANAVSYIQELEAVDQELKTVFGQMETSKFIIMHPSMGYFADDYGLTMVELEQDGKKSSAAHMQVVIDYARANEIKVIFYQAEFDAQQAETLAAEVGGTTMALEVLSPDYINNLKKILVVFKDTLK